MYAGYIALVAAPVHMKRPVSAPNELARNSANSAGFRNVGSHNPSVLARPIANHPGCTHDRFRAPKTGSIALFNAAQLDPRLHRWVCWDAKRGVHTPPRPNHPRPVLVALRHPVNRLASSLAYSDWLQNSTATVVVGSSLPPVALRLTSDNYGPDPDRRRDAADPADVVVSSPTRAAPTSRSSCAVPSETPRSPRSVRTSQPPYPRDPQRQAPVGT